MRKWEGFLEKIVVTTPFAFATNVTNAFFIIRNTKEKTFLCRIFNETKAINQQIN